MDKYEQIAVEILEDVSEVDGLSDDKSLDLFEAGLLDSLSVISIIIMIENKLGLRLQPTDFKPEDIGSVTAFANFLASKEE